MFINQMYKIRNLLLCHPKEIEDYSEKENGEIEVRYTNNISIIVKFHSESGYYLKVINHYAFGRVYEVFKGFLKFEECLYKITFMKNRSAEDRMFDLFREVKVV